MMIARMLVGMPSSSTRTAKGLQTGLTNVSFRLTIRAMLDIFLNGGAPAWTYGVMVIIFHCHVRPARMATVADWSITLITFVTRTTTIVAKYPR